jgi:RNA polymerase sigma-70 factor (ECF subfamily)
LSAIYREHYAFVWAILRRLGVHERDLEDVVQDVFIVVHRRLGQFEGRASIRTWLYAVTVRVAWNHLRRRARRPSVAESSSTGLPAPVTHADPEEFAARNQASALLHALLDRLDPAKRAVFVLADIEGLPAPQIARIVGANTRTVYSRLRAARHRFELDLRRVHAREQAPYSRRELFEHAAVLDAPPGGSQRRTWAALLVRLGDGAVATAASGGLGLGTLAVATAGSLGLGAAVLALIYLVSPDPVPVPVAAQPAARIVELTPPEIEVPAAPLAHRPPSDPTTLAVARPAPPERARPRPPPGTPSTAVSGSGSPELELRLMRSAREALRAGDGRAALQHLEAHERDFPRGVFAPERDRSRVTALCSEGRGDEAMAVAARIGLDPPVCDQPAR